MTKQLIYKLGPKKYQVNFAYDVCRRCKEPAKKSVMQWCDVDRVKLCPSCIVYVNGVYMNIDYFRNEYEPPHYVRMLKRDI